MRSLEFVRYLYQNQKAKFFAAIFIVTSISVQFITSGVDVMTFLGFILGLVLLILMDRQKTLKALIVLVVTPCILLAIIIGYHPPERYQSSILGFVVSGVLVLLYREYVIFRNNHKK